MKWQLLATMLLSSVIATAQFTNVRIDDGSTPGYAPCEPSIAIDPNNPDRIVAGGILNKLYTSLDGGKTWQINLLTSRYGVFGDPCIVAGNKGKFYFFHLSDPSGKGWADTGILDRIVSQRITLGKKVKWCKGSSIGLNPPKDQDKEWAVFNHTQQKLHCTWTEFDKYGSPKAEDESRILFSSTNAKAKKWTTPVQLNEIAGDCIDDDQTVEGAVPAVDKEGNIYVTWALGDTLYFDRSFDGGNTWLAKDKRIASIAGGWTMDIPGINRCNGMPITFCDTSDGPYAGTIHVHWADQRNGTKNTDVWHIYSRDMGETWSEPIRVNQDEGEAHQFFTWATLDQSTGYVYAVYYDRRAATASNPLSTAVYLAYSTDGGATWKDVKISEGDFTPNERFFFGDYNNISAVSGQIRPIWTRLDQGKHSVWTALIEHKNLP